MKVNDVRFDGEPDRFGQSFQRECLLNKWLGESYIKHVYGLVHKAKNMEELIELVLSDEYMKNTQAYAEISKRSRAKEHWYRIREMFGEKQFKTLSDAGGVKIGNDGFNTIIHNGYGDGETRVAIFESDDLFNSDMLNFVCTINGDEINIYSYDCGNKIVKTIKGSYIVYSYQGFVAFKKVNM